MPDSEHECIGIRDVCPTCLRVEAHRLREQTRVMADWLDMLTAMVLVDRGNVLAVVEGRKAADHGRALARVEAGPLAREPRTPASGEFAPRSHDEEADG